MSSIVKQQKMIKADVQKNNNKFWYIFMYDDNRVVTEFGRVGYSSQTSEKPCNSKFEAERYYSKKCKEKESGRNGEIPYRKLNVIENSSTVSSTSSLSIIAESQIETDSNETKDLIKTLVKQNIHNIVSSTNIKYNASGTFSTPCGVITKDAIDSARNILLRMSDYIQKKQYDDTKYKGLLNDYLMLVPQDVGRKLDPTTIYTSQQDVEKQNDILDSLEVAVGSIVNSAQISTDKVFDVKLARISDKQIIDSINQFYYGSKNTIHSCSHLKPVKVYSVSIKTMEERFDTIKNKIGNIKRLWHGTKVSNVLSILKNGLIIPKSNASFCTGRLFGDGVYFSDQSTKSLNYSYGYWSGGSRDNHCFMFLADVAMGKEYIPSNKGSSYFPVKGYDSTFAIGGKSGVMNNEMIVYDIAQCNLNYLIEFN